MRLFVGLGNPGSKYANNRHNIGFMVVDELAARAKAGAAKAKFGAEITEGSLGGERITFCKPMEFMNLSGFAVQRVSLLPHDSHAPLPDGVPLSSMVVSSGTELDARTSKRAMPEERNTLRPGPGVGETGHRRTSKGARKKGGAALASRPSPGVSSVRLVYQPPVQAVIRRAVGQPHLPAGMVRLHDLHAVGHPVKTLHKLFGIIGGFGRFGGSRLGLAAGGTGGVIVRLHGHCPKYMMCRTQNVSRPASSFSCERAPGAAGV